MVKTFHKKSSIMNFENTMKINASNIFQQWKTRFRAWDNKRLKIWLSVHLAFDGKGLNVLTLAAWNAGAGPARVGTSVLRCFRLSYVLPAKTCDSLRNQDFADFAQLKSSGQVSWYLWPWVLNSYRLLTSLKILKNWKKYKKQYLLWFILIVNPNKKPNLIVLNSTHETLLGWCFLI